MKSDVTLAGLTLAQRTELLSLARARNLARRGSELPPIEPASRDGRVPLSFAQQRLWFLAQLRDLGTTYHIPRRLRLRGELDRDALVRALDRIVARHEGLRTAFAQEDGVPEQRIAPADSGFHLVEHDLAGRADAEAELERLVTEEGRAPFDLEHGPLIRGRLIRVAADDHVLLLTMHHIVSDGWSMGVLTRELGTLYAAFRGGEPDPLPALEVQYADYAVWQRRWVDGAVLREQAEYWTRTLAGAPELLELPTDHPRPAQMDHAGAQLLVELDAELTAGLKALSRRNGTTLFMTLLAGWAVVLSRLSGQDDVVIGSPMAGRGRPEIEGLIGFFVNTLALRLDLSGAPTVAELLGRVKERVIQAQHNQDIPFEQVVELVDPARSLAHHPLFQALFAWQNTPRGDGLSLPGLEAGGVGGGAAATLARPQANRDLSLSLREADGRIVGNVLYATTLFEAETVERFAGYLRRVLGEMAADESRPVARLALMPADERARVLREWNRTEAEYPAGSCIHELFQRQVERTPDATAAVYEGDRLTYAELNARANRLAHHLRALGVGPDTRVAVCVERSLETLVGLLAVLKAGGAYVPLDPGYPAERLAYMLADAAPAAVLTQRALRGRVEDAGVPVLELDAAAPAWASEAETNPARGALTPEHLAYVIYTSGSTGMPKGVVVPHRAVVSQLAWGQRTWALGAHEAVLQRISLSFDVSVRELFWALTVGARVVLAGPSGANDPAALVEVVAREGIGVVHAVPTLLQAFLEHPDVGSCTTLTRVMCGGEVLSPALARRFRERLPGATPYHMYGPTETTVGVTAASCGPEHLDGRIPLGRPIANTRAYVLDPRGEPVPVGVAGELCIGGAQLSRGYLGRPAQTADRFVADPFGGQPGARLYRTGDLARWLPDGTLEFLGRTDDQVKLRGFRIELGEIEARLREHPAVREAVALVREDAPGDRRLVAYVAGDEAGADVLRAHVGETLPEYMVPAAYVRLDALPLSPNGKVDRKALPAPEEDAFAARLYEAPLGDTEQVLAGIWAEVLRLERVGRHDHFFELGGHSLLAVQVISRVRQALRVEVALGEMFTRPVLSDFARGLQTAARSELPSIGPASREGRLPLSFAQQRLWFLEQLGSLGGTYHMFKRLRLRGPLDRDALVRALDGIVARHEALRTTFAQVDGVPEQRIAPADTRFHLVEHDLGGQADAEAELGRWMAEEAGAPFDLERGPLIRGRLVRLAPDDHALLLTMHHIVSDGWSMEVLTRELSALYGAFRRGEPDPLPALPVQYADYAVWQRRRVEGDVLQAQADYWAETLAGAPELLELPTDRPRPARMDHAGATIGLVLDEELAAGLRALSRRHGATLFMTLLAGWAVVLGRLSGEDDVVIGTPTAGRGRREIEGLIGFFVNTLALRVDLSGAPTVAELLARVKERALTAQHHQDIPFEQVVERLDPVRSLSHTPLVQVMFAWQDASQAAGASFPGLEVGRVGAGSPRVEAKFDLSLAFWAAGDRIAGGVTYATALFEQATVERYLGYLRRVLEEMVADEGRRVERLALMSGGERARVLEAWSRTGADAAGPCVHALFEAQAARTPDAPAVVFEGERLTYAELNRRANRLAHHLVRRGVGPDVRVGVCVEPGVEMMAAVLAVLKAGGAYVPLDPAYPEDRLAYTLADSAPAVLLTQASLAERFAGAEAPRIRIDADAAEWAREPETDPARGVRPEHLAYVIYTSGSTGRPKGVRVEHGALAATLAAAGRAFGLGPADRAPSLASFAFDIWLFEALLPLLAGGSVRLFSRDRVLEVPRLVQDLAACTVLHAVPALMRRIVQEVRAAGEGVLPGLRSAFVGGDAVAPDLLEEMRIAFPAAEIHVLYGPTEAAVICAAHRLGGEPASRQMVGRPLGNAALYVLLPGGDLAPVGAPGELCLGGRSVARDYLGRPELTAERFAPDPFSAAPGARLYRTGDRVRWLSTGELEFLGRTDRQVKVRGFRIEPGEIEARLVEHPGVRDAVVVVREDTPGEKRLVAYVAADESAGAEALRAHLGERLPAYMVPAAYVRLDALPLTPNGKVDRKSLPAPEDDAFARRAYEAPVGETEAALAEIWSEVLRIDRVGRGDSFFEVGGHSLLAVQVISRVRQALRVEVALGELFARPVLGDFARALETAARAELPPIEPADREGRVPLSFAQQRLWFLEQLGNLGGAYHIPMRLRLHGALYRAALVRALDGIVARHEALRTVFAEVDGAAEQRIVPAEASRFHLVEHDLDGAADAEDELRRLVSDEAGGPFDLARGPLIRGRLIRLAADDHVLVLTMHHIVSDGWSMGVLMRELGTLYAAFARGGADPLPPLAVQYADYAAWQRRWVEGEVLRAQADYWTRTLSGAPELLELPTDRPRPAQMNHAGARLGVELDEALTASLTALSRRHGTTLFMTLLAGWAAVLSRLSGQKDVVVGTPTANRGRREIEGLIGFFVNTLALRVDLSGAPTAAELLGRVKERALEAQHHQDIPFEQVVELAAPVRSLSHGPLFQVMFAWQNAPGGSLELPGLALGRVDALDEHRTAKEDLSLALGEANGRIVGGVTYATSLFERDTVERWLGYLRHVLEEMVADESRPVERLALMPADERARVLEEWNRTEAAYPGEACVHQLFEARVERDPAATAVVFDGGRLTYGELNARANRLAHHLRGLGVGPEVRVALVMPRSPELVEAELAVLKCGGAYVPLDPEHPGDRLREMVEDSAPAALLTTTELAERFAGLALPVLALDATAPAWASRPATNPAVEGLTPEHLAYVMYTSGSTGRPKGVMVAHRSIVRLVVDNGYAPFGADDRVAFAANPAFDATTMEVWAPLVNGGTIVVIDQDTLLDPQAMGRALEAEGVTALFITTAVFNRYAAEIPGALAGLRFLLTGGEACDPASFQRVLDQGGSGTVIHCYGPTETTTYAITHDVRHVAEGARSIPLGGPIGNTRVYLLDRAGEPVPVGVAGELYIGGAGVARGYQGRPALTAERFVPDPWGEAGARLYRTGDLVRWLPEGTIEFLGRTDHQVKVRGFRIEPGEIEARLLEHPGVREVMVLVREDTPGDKRLVAYVAGDETAGAEALRAHLGERLPAYMVPAAYVRLDALPLTPNGKVDRRALPAPEDDAFARRGYEAPLGPTEEALAEIWAEVLGLERVGRDDGFFELGGHSLLAVTLIARMRRQGLHADVRTLFAAPTLAALAAAVGGESAEVQVPPNRIPPASAVITPQMLPLVALDQAQVDAIVATVPGGAANVQDIYPLAPLQEGFLFHHLVAAEGDPYLLCTVDGFETRERLDAYLRALGAVIARHDVLRTAIAWENVPEPVQVVWREAPLLVEEVEVDPAGGDVAGQLYRRFDPRHHRIDLRQAPLMRGYVARDEAGERWVLLLLRHHLAIDHAALEVLQEEIHAHLRGRADQLPAPLPFRNYVAQARLGVSADEHREFFTGMLGDVDEPTAPFGLLDVRGDGTGIGEARVWVEGPLAGRLRERARALGVSAATLCHVAWAQVLARVSGREDVVFGTVLFGRMQGGEGADRVIGPFINTLPIRVRLGDVGVEASVRQTHALLARLLRHEHASLALAQRCSAVDASAPLFTSLLNYRHSGRKTGSGAPAAPAPAAAEGTRKRYTRERSNYPLTMSVDDLGEALALTAKVQAQVEAARVCALMHTALEGLVEALERAPQRPVGSVSVLPESERAQVLEAWNRTEADYPGESCVHELFERQAARTPDAEAVVFEGARLTYAELNARANRLAHHLRSLGVGPDARVGICAERSLEMVVGMLAVLKAGGGYVPLDPGYPAERLAHMLADSAPAAVLTQTHLRDRVAGADAPVLELDAAAPAWAGASEQNPARGALAPGHLAYLTYTSGSTGRPKGVMNPHRGSVNRLTWMQSRHELGVGEGVLQNSSFSFDASVFEIFWPLAVGGRVVLPRPVGHRDPEYLMGVIGGERVSTAYFVCSMLRLFLEYEGVERCTGLTRVLCGGEPLSPALAQRVRERLPRARLHNLYGPTESAVSVTGLVTAGDDALATVPIGRPAPNVRIYLLDAWGGPVPVGVAGELYVAGAQLARGYLDRPGLTAERFVPDPFGGGAGERLYRTGDLGRWRADGRIEFLGRTDFQVKVRGFRIEPAEIEARLLEHPGVRAAVVLAREDTPGETRLVAYVVGDQTAGADVLRAYLGQTLPEYMVPAAYVRLDALPLTPNGKLDRRALPAPEGEAYASREYEPPVNETEEALAGIWAEVLRVERVGRRDNFFELGGHSLLAVRVISRVRQVLGVEVALGELFTRPVLGDFARELAAAARPALPPVEPAPREGRVPLSFAQQRLWFLEQLGGLGSAYHIRGSLRLRGALDRAALVRALDGVVARHEALRTVFAQVDGAPEQRIAPADAGFHLVEHDLDGRADAEAGLGRWMAEEARAPFDLERGPLIRGRLIRLAADDHVLLLTMHHIVSDAWSMGVLFGELSTLYAAHARGTEAHLPALPVQYADYAAWQRRWVQGEVLEAQAEYWTRTLAGAPEWLELPADRPRPARVDHAGAMLGVELDAELTAGLKALSRRHGTTLFITLLAGWATVLGRLSGQAEVVVGTPSAGRGRREIEGLIGFFVNTLALRIDLSGAPSVADVLARVKERALRAQQNQDIPFEQVVERVDPVRSLSHSPLFQVMFAWQDTQRGGGLSLPGLEVGGVGGASSHVQSQFDLSLALRTVDERIVGSVTYATALFDRESVERWADSLRRVLREMVADESRPVERLALMPESERARVVQEWNRTEADFPREACLHELIEAQVRRTPGAGAVVFEGEELTCAELNARANRLAHHLIALGVGPDVRVGVCADRSLEMMVALLGVLKAGGAYVPLDPGYPADRLAYMLADSAPAVVLAQTHLRDRVEGAGVPVLELDAAAPAWADRPATDPERGALTPDHLAYVIYTSGSTGRPKGVGVQHRGVVNRLSWMEAVHGLGPRETVLQKTPYSFDVSVWELFWPLAAGARLVIARPDGHRDPAYLLEVVRRERITTVHFVPSLLAAFLAHLDAEGGGVPELRRVVSSGEALPPELVARFGERLPGVELHNLYGPTEASVDVTFWRCPTDGSAARVSIGRPVPNARIYLLDPVGEPVPVGVPGELYIGGVQVARGYLGRAGLTAERFVPDPFGSEPGARLYRTGDRARWLADGTIEYLGRIDFQVKVRGFRIELGEIEARLREHPGVREAVVLAREDTPGETRLVAYVAGEAVEAETLRAHLGERLPAYMVPAAFVALDRLPLTPNGKLDRKALPAPEWGAPAERYVAPRTPLEEALCGAWAEVLGVERVGMNDDFFELGGHSMLAPKLVFRLRDVLGIEVPLGILFRAPTVAELAHEVGAVLAGRPAEARVRRELDLEADSQLDAEICPPVSRRRTPVPAARVLLTGATGFLGAHLLRELLRTGAQVLCAVRAPDDDAARARLRAHLTGLALWDEAAAGAIVPVTTDLSRPLLGLSPDAFADLADRVEAIYHCGAAVNHTYSYPALRAANVEGTREVLRLAVLAGGVPVHFISTASVAGGGGAGPRYEDALLDRKSVHNGYAQSKWVAERLVRAAGARGLPVSIHRPGWVTGATDSGISNERDFIWHFVKGCVQLGAVPDSPGMYIDMVPADFVSRAIVHLSSREDSLDRGFHFTNPHLVAWGEMAAWLRGCGYRLATLPYDAWVAEVVRAGSGAEPNALYPFIPQLSASVGGPARGAAPRLDQTNTRAGLEGSSIRCPRPDATLFGRYIEHFVRTGWLPPAPAGPAAGHQRP